MASCGACGREFSGTPWMYRSGDGVRVHVDCGVTPAVRARPLPEAAPPVDQWTLVQERWHRLAAENANWSVFARGLAVQPEISRHRGEMLERVVNAHDPAVVSMSAARRRLKGTRQRGRTAWLGRALQGAAR